MGNFLFYLLIVFYSSQGFCFRPFILHSGKKQLKLIEFYFNQNCQNCEGPQQWVSSLRKDKGLWKHFVVLSAETEGPLARPELETQYKKLTEIPGFLVNGNEWQWESNNEIPRDLGDDVGELSVARIKLEEFEVTFNPRGKVESPRVIAALLGHGVPSDFTALQVNTKDLKRVGDGWSCHIKLAMKKDPEAKGHSAVFWIVDGETLLQAVGGDLKLD